MFKDKKDEKDFEIFIKRLANMSYDTMELLPVEKDFGINSEDYMELIYNLTWSFHPEISSGTSIKLSMQSTITELGLCFAINSKIAVYSSYE